MTNKVLCFLIISQLLLILQSIKTSPEQNDSFKPQTQRGSSIHAKQRRQVWKQQTFSSYDSKVVKKECLHNSLVWLPHAGWNFGQGCELSRTHKARSQLEKSKGSQWIWRMLCQVNCWPSQATQLHERQINPKRFRFVICLQKIFPLKYIGWSNFPLFSSAHLSSPSPLFTVTWISAPPKWDFSQLAKH